MAIPKKVKYHEERKDILQKLYDILHINEYNRLIVIDNFEKDEETNRLISEMTNDIKKYFSCGKWMYYNKGQTNKTHISLVKNIIKDMGFEISVAYIMEPTNKSIRMKGLYIHQ